MKKKNKVEKLPKTIFIRRVEIDNQPGQFHYVAEEDVVGLVDIGESVFVGKYVLEETYVVEGVVRSEPADKAKRVK